MKSLLRRLSRPGLLALLLSCAALALGVWMNREDADLADQRASLNARRLELHRHQAAPPERSLHDFQAVFPPDTARQNRTAALLELCVEQGLPLPRSEFRYGADAALGLARYRIHMSLNGNYAQLRSFAAEALRRDPALALESLRLRRDQPAGSEVSAELGWVLYMQTPSMVLHR